MSSDSKYFSEVIVYKISKNLVETLSSKFFVTSHLVKEDVKILKKTKDYSIIKNVINL